MNLIWNLAGHSNISSFFGYDRSILF